MREGKNKKIHQLGNGVIKLVIILIIIGLNWTGLSAIGTTVAFYNDTETASGNTHIAGQLDFILDQSAWAPPGGELDLDAGESVSRDITIIDVDDKSIDFKYIVSPEKTGGDDDFCNALELDAFLEGAPQYTGSLFDFVSATTTFATTTDTWTFNVSLPSGAPDFDGAVCEFDFVYSGWQAEFPNEGQGFNDIERASSVIESKANLAPNVCPFEAGPGKTVVVFNKKLIRSDKHESDAFVGPLLGYVPAGTYDITLASYDNHSGHGGQGQPEEQWYLILDDLNGDTIATTSAISDLPENDDQIIEKVETGFTLDEDVFFATAYHKAYPDHHNPNSITPLCALFEGPNAGQEFAPPDDLIGAPAGRAEEGLLALYTFEEEDETIVWDVSGVGTPLNLLIGDSSATHRVSGGLSIDSSTILSDLAPTTKIIDGVQATGELTIEAWIAPENTTQDGPARIVTYSKDTSNRNFTLGQGKWGGYPSDVFDIRLRTTDTSSNGIPSITTPSGTATTDLTHVVYTRDSYGNARTFIDGAEVASTTISGSVSNWDGSYRFALANEFTMNRTWLGDIHLVALYNKALSASEVEQNFKAGADRTIVLNEFLPNPIGADDAGKPNGEWVELYNLSDTAIDVDGWYLYDALDSHQIPISAANSDNDGDIGDAGETIVPSGGYLVVYLDGAYSSGWLNNSGGDTIRLYNGPIGTGVLVDSYSYSGSAPENKSYARIPDGTGAFVDPIPTPLAPNKADEEETISLDSSSKQEQGQELEQNIEETAFVREEMIEPEKAPDVANGGDFGDAPSDDEPVLEEETAVEEKESANPSAGVEEAVGEEDANQLAGGEEEEIAAGETELIADFLDESATTTSEIIPETTEASEESSEETSKEASEEAVEETDTEVVVEPIEEGQAKEGIAEESGEIILKNEINEIIEAEEAEEELPIIGAEAPEIVEIPMTEKDTAAEEEFIIIEPIAEPEPAEENLEIIEIE